MMNRRFLIVAAALALLPAACKRGNGESLKLSGNIEAIPVELSFRVGGKVLERPVDEGQVVREGQLIARLDARDLEQQVAIQEANAPTAKAALEQAQADFERLKPDEARVRQLFTQGILSARDAEASRAALEAARAKVDQAGQQYALVRKGPRPEDIDQGKARSQQAQQALALARTQLEYATLVAPSAGVILSKNLEAKEFAAPGTSVVTLADLRQVWLRAYIEEAELGRVKVGQKAWISTDAYPGKRYEGRVAFLASEAEFTPKAVQTRKERVKLVYRIKIEVPNLAMELKPGMPADAEIALEGR